MQKLGAILTVLLASGTAAAQTPGFWLVGVSPGADFSQTVALSADGGVAAGASSNGVGYTWTRENGRYDFGLEPGMPGVTTAYGVTNNAQTIAGRMFPNINNSQLSRAYRRVGNGPLVDLGVIPGTSLSYSRGISGDGNTVVGACEPAQTSGVLGKAFRWTPQGGMQNLGHTRPDGWRSIALAVSLDGRTIVGESTNSGATTDAFVWRESTGIQPLPRLPGAASNSWSRASAVNSDGTVIVGDGDSPVTGTSTAVRWAAGGVQDLGTVPGYRRSVASAVDGSGNIIAGDTYTSLIGLPDTAFVWTPLTGMRTISEYLSGYGVAVPAGYRVGHVAAISDDGQTFAGYVINLGTGYQEGFVVTVPSSASGLVLLLLPAMRRRRPLTSA